MMRKIAFITGASSGIGAALAPLFARDGYAVALTARRQDLLEEIAAKIRSAGGEALPIVCDVTNRESVHAAVRSCERELGPVECLVANAGMGGATAPDQFDATVVESIIRTNLLGAAYCIEAVLPGMIERRSGHLVGISSLASYRGLPNMAGYCASKSGLNALLESLRLGLRSYNVAVTTICPGFIKTPMTARNRNPMPFLVELEDAAEKMYRAIRRKKRMYSFPWQLASVVRAARFLPDAIYDRAFAGARVRKDPA